MVLKREGDTIAAVQRVYRAGNTTEARLDAAVREMLQMGGLYVKFAQLLLLNQVFSKVVTPELRRAVFDRVYVNEKNTLSSLLTKDDRSTLRKKLTSVHDKPSFAGSFAIIFEGTHLDGTPVIIKVIRPELQGNLKRDLRLIKLLVKAIGAVKGEVKTSLKSAFKTFEETVIQETDYLRERHNSDVIGRTLKNNPYLLIPHMYKELSNSRILVQEKLEGVWVSELLSKNLKAKEAANYVKEKTGSELEVQLFQLGYQNFYMSLCNLPVHGDPHPGNIVLMKNNKIGMIDLGIIAEPVANRLALLEYIKEQILSKEGDVDLARFMLSMVRFHANYLYQAIATLSVFYKQPLIEQLYVFLRDEVKREHIVISKEDIASGRQSEVFTKSLNRNNRFGLQAQIDNPLNQKAFITIWRTYDELGYEHMILDVFRVTVETIETQEDTADWQEDTMPVDQAFEIIAEWLNMIAEKDAALFGRMKKLFRY